MKVARIKTFIILSNSMRFSSIHFFLVLVIVLNVLHVFVPIFKIDPDGFVRSCDQTWHTNSRFQKLQVRSFCPNRLGMILNTS